MVESRAYTLCQCQYLLLDYTGDRNHQPKNVAETLIISSTYGY
ncbi:hypothetical protein [Nostoc sp.]